MPTPAELDHAEATLQKAHNEYENIDFAFEYFANCFEAEGIVPDPLPTEADVGRFYLFAHYLELKSQELHDMADEIIGNLPALGEMPGNVKLWQRKAS